MARDKHDIETLIVKTERYYNGQLMVYALARVSAFFLYLMDYVMLIGIYVYRNTKNNNTTATCGKWDRVLERGIGEKIWGSICLCVYGV